MNASSAIATAPVAELQDRLSRAAVPSVAPVRVLHVINGEHYSGAERVQDLLANRLPSLGFEVGFACLKPGSFAALRRAQQARLDNVPMSSRFDLRPAWQLAQLVRQHSYTLVHTHSPRAAIVGSLATSLTRVPHVHHLHSPTSCDSTRGWPDKLSARAERYSLWNAAAVIAVSSSLSDYAASQGISDKRLRVVPNGVPVQGPLSDRSPPGGTWTLGTVALFRPRKGLEVLLESLARLRVAGLDVRLRCVGRFETPEYQRTIKGQVARLGIAPHVDWIGFSDDVPRELALLDLFVLPSLFGEGLPMVVLEAMAAGVPVVGTRVEGIPQAIRDGREGRLVRPNDPGDLAAAIADFVRGQVDWSALRVAAHRRQAEWFSDTAMAEGVAEVYQQVLAR